MYLSRVEINPRLRATKLALNSPQRLHAMIEASFPNFSAGHSMGDVTEVEKRDAGGHDVDKRRLWRLDKLGRSLYLLTVSAVPPDFTHLIEQVGWSASGQTWETKPYDSFLAHLRHGQEWQFRLRANPTHSVKDKDAPRSRGIVRACIKIDEQKKWLETQAPKQGFSLNGFELIDRSVSEFLRQQETVTLHTTLFEGFLKVEDPVALRKALSVGIGRAKAYGCGLLTLVKPYVGS
jgi:CRISPR system Cascade subunit CasE